MSNYTPLWEHIARNKITKMTFAEIEGILGFSLDHSFLTYKKELCGYGYMVEKISMKCATVSFRKAE